MSEQDKQYITIPMTVPAEDFWSNTMGSGWEYGYAWVGIKYLDGADWDKLGRFVISYLDHNDDEGEEKVLTKELGVEDLAKAYGVAVSEGYFHCGSRWDWEDQDACTSDGILQIAELSLVPRDPGTSCDSDSQFLGKDCIVVYS